MFSLSPGNRRQSVMPSMLLIGCNLIQTPHKGYSVVALCRSAHLAENVFNKSTVSIADGIRIGQAVGTVYPNGTLGIYGKNRQKFIVLQRVNQLNQFVDFGGPTSFCIIFVEVRKQTV